jgi:hypothetical protein
MHSLHQTPVNAARLNCDNAPTAWPFHSHTSLLFVVVFSLVLRSRSAVAQSHVVCIRRLRPVCRSGAAASPTRTRHALEHGQLHAPIIGL